MNHFKKYSIAFIVVVLATLLGGLSSSLARTDRAEVLRNLEKFSRVYQKIISSYVEDEDSDVLIDAAIDAMLGELDPFSQYLDEDQVEDLLVKTKGEFGGLGIIISKRGEYPTVISPIEDTPAFRLGIQGGDKIVEIEGESTRNWTVQDAVDKLRGPKGTSVNIGIERYGVDEILPYHIVRDIIEVKSVPYHFVLDGDIGYVRCTNFGEQTVDELRASIEDLESQGIKGLILDLRNNPGGLLEAARDVSDLFLDSGQVIVSTRGRDGERLQEIYAEGQDAYASDYPLVLMINEGSASASEIVAGAVQDWDRGLVVGRNSFGKGSVQSIFSISDREALKLTTAKYYTPSGRCIHKSENDHRFTEEEEGQPDYELDTPEAEETPLDSLPLYETLSLHRPVRGGGGIMPDIIFQAREISNTALDLERRAAFFNFAVEWTSSHEIGRDFKVDDETLGQFAAYLKDQEIELEEGQFEENEDYIRIAIRREVLYKEFGSQAAYRSTLEMDDDLQKTLALLKESTSLARLLALSELETEPR